MITDAGLLVANHLLRQHEAWAPAQLLPFAGGIIEVILKFGDQPSVSRIQIGPDGFLLKAQQSDELARAKLIVPIKLDYLSILARDGVAGLMRSVQIEGDIDLASAIGKVAKDLRWDAEEDLSRVFGDIVAHRMATGASQFFHQANQFFNTTQRGLAQRAVKPDSGLLVAREEFDQMKADLRTLRDGLDRFEQRYELSLKSQ